MSSQPTAPAARVLAGATVGIPPRHLNFHLPDEAPRYVLGNNPFASTVIGMLSGFFPPGERFFMDSVRHFKGHIKDDALQAAISGFIGQEAMHGKEHDKLNAYFLARGIRVDMAEKGVALAMSMLGLLPVKQQLACTVFMEDITAILAEELLTNQMIQREADPEMIKMWFWHALEELEHKSVSHDVYEAVRGGYLRRLLAVGLVTGIVLPSALASVGIMLYKDGQLGSLLQHKRGFRMIFGKGGLFQHVPKRLKGFFARDFSPRDRNTSQLEQQWRDHLFGKQGLLDKEFKNRAMVERSIPGHLATPIQ